MGQIHVIDFSRTKFSFRRNISDYTRVQHAYSALIRNKRIQISRMNGRDKEYLNVGCGPNPNDDFINMDYFWHPKIDLCWDVTKPFPFTSSSFNGIYTEHCLEHVAFSQCRLALKEFHRLLKPGGILRIILPDAGKYLKLYNQSLNGESVSFPYSNEDDPNIYSPIVSVNRVFRNYGHQFAYDSEILSVILKDAGFTEVKEVEFMVGKDSTMLIDTESRKGESLYIEAIA